MAPSLLTCERTRPQLKDKGGKSSFRFPFRARHARSPTSPTIFISSKSPSLKHQRSGSSLSELRIGLGKCRKAKTSVSSGDSSASSYGKQLPATPSSGGSLANVVDSPLSQIKIPASFTLGHLEGYDYYGQTGKRSSIPEMLLSPSAVEVSFPPRPPHPRSSSMPNVQTTRRPSSFAERLERRMSRESLRYSPENNESEPGSATSRAPTSRRKPPPPIKIPPPHWQHRRQRSVPINVDAESQALPSISIGLRRNPTPPSSDSPSGPIIPPQLPTLLPKPPTVQNLVAAIHRYSTSTISSSDSASKSGESERTITTPAQVINAQRVGREVANLQMRRATNFEIPSISIPKAVALPTLLTKNSVSPSIVKTAAPAAATGLVCQPSYHTPAATAVSFPSSPYRHSLDSNVSTVDKHYSETSFDIHSLPFRSPHHSQFKAPPVPPLPSLKAVEGVMKKADPCDAIRIELSQEQAKREAAVPLGKISEGTPTTASSLSRSLPASSPFSSVATSAVTSGQGSFCLPLRQLRSNHSENLLRPLETRLAVSSPDSLSPSNATQLHSALDSSYATTLAADMITPPTPPVFKWDSVSIADAKQVHSSKELSAIVTHAIRRAAQHPPKFVVEGFEEMVLSSEAAQEEVSAAKAELQLEIDARARTLFRHVACLRVFNGEEGARFAQTLVKTVTKSDALAEQVRALTEQEYNIKLAEESHLRAAATLSLVKLNTSFIRAQEEQRHLKAKLAAVQKERDDALARLNEVDRRRSGMPSSQMTPPYDSAEPTLHPSPMPSPFGSDPSPILPEIPGIMRKGSAKLKAALSRQMDRMAPHRRTDFLGLPFDGDQSGRQRSRSASVPSDAFMHDYDPFAAGPVRLPPPTTSTHEILETLIVTGQVPSSLASLDQLSHARTRSGTNLSSISLSEVDSSALAQMLGQ